MELKPRLESNESRTHVELSRTYPVSRSKGFAYFMDVAAWDEWTTLTVVEPETTVWREPGDVVNYRYATPIAGVPLNGSAMLEEVRPEELVKMRLRTTGLPDAPVECAFSHAGLGAFTLTLMVHAEDPPGFFGAALQQLTMMETFAARDMRRCLDGLERTVNQLKAA